MRLHTSHRWVQFSSVAQLLEDQFSPASAVIDGRNPWKTLLAADPDLPRNVTRSHLPIKSVKLGNSRGGKKD